MPRSWWHFFEVSIFSFSQPTPFKPFQDIGAPFVGEEADNFAELFTLIFHDILSLTVWKIATFWCRHRQAQRCLDVFSVTKLFNYRFIIHQPTSIAACKMRVSMVARITKRHVGQATRYRLRQHDGRHLSVLFAISIRKDNRHFWIEIFQKKSTWVGPSGSVD
jgi:hypothetical protein